MALQGLKSVWWVWAFTWMWTLSMKSGIPWRSLQAPQWSQGPQWSRAHPWGCQPRTSTHTQLNGCLVPNTLTNLPNTCILNNSSKCGKGLILYMLYIWGKDEADSYRWTTVDAFSSKEELLSMDHNSSMPGRHKNTNKPNPMKVVNYS